MGHQNNLNVWTLIRKLWNGGRAWFHPNKVGIYLGDSRIVRRKSNQRLLPKFGSRRCHPNHKQYCMCQTLALFSCSVSQILEKSITDIKSKWIFKSEACICIYMLLLLLRCLNRLIMYSHGCWGRFFQLIAVPIINPRQCVHRTWKGK